MWYMLLLCILVNAYVVIVFKIFDWQKINLLPAIVINYFICVLTGLIFFQPPSSILEVVNAPWFPFSIFLGAVFIIVFNLIGNTIKEFGIMLSTIFQKMSLIGPAMVGILFYGESLGIAKLLGIGTAIVAIILISHPEKGVRWKGTNLWLPFATLLGSAILEITLFYVNIEKYADNADPTFVMCIFLMAGVFGLVYMMIKSAKHKIHIRRKELIGGIALGIPNFFSIYLVLFLLNKGWDGSSLFPIINVGILFIASLFGIYFFREKLDTLKIAGFAMAIISITLIAFS